MQIGMVGLGRMGANMTQRLLQHGHEVVAYDIKEEEVEEAANNGATPAWSLKEVVASLEPPRAVWLMVPAGDITGRTIEELAAVMDPGDAIVDGGNSHYPDTVRRAQMLEEKDLGLVDAGTSGGVWGLTEGYCLMIGAQEETYERLKPIFAALAPEGGYARVGGPGCGHYTKMVHNGIEYALMQAYGEGFELLYDSEFELDLPTIANVWRHGSVIRSWLLDLAANAFEGDAELSQIAAYVEDSGEGRWTLETAIDRAIPVPTIAVSLFSRFASRRDVSFSAKVVAALRREFGGHEVKKTVVEPGGETGM